MFLIVTGLLLTPMDYLSGFYSPLWRVEAVSKCKDLLKSAT